MDSVHRVATRKRGVSMTTRLRFGCGRAGTLFYEPEGLLIRTCLIPKDDRHSEHLLTFQLGYLGAGQITLHVSLAASPDPDACLPPEEETAPITAVALRGTDAAAAADGLPPGNPGVWLTYCTLRQSRVHYRYSVWGQTPPDGSEFCGVVTTDVEGSVPNLTATTSAGVTRHVPQVPAFVELGDLLTVQDPGSQRCSIAASAGPDPAALRGTFRPARGAAIDTGDPTAPAPCPQPSTPRLAGS